VWHDLLVVNDVPTGLRPTDNAENWLLNVHTLISVSLSYRTHDKFLPQYAANVAYVLLMAPGGLGAGRVGWWNTNLS
jgi:hypothetical protein